MMAYYQPLAPHELDELEQTIDPKLAGRIKATINQMKTDHREKVNHLQSEVDNLHDLLEKERHTLVERLDF